MARRRSACGLFCVVALSGCVLADVCDPVIPLSKDSDKFGGACPLDDPNRGATLTKLSQRVGVEAALIHQVATAYPVSADFGGLTSLNSFPQSNASINGLPGELAMSLRVLRISDISQKAQTFKMHYILNWAWRDCRLLSQCKSMMISDRHEDFDKFWTPTLRIQEREDDNRHMLVQAHQVWGHGWDLFTEEHVSTFRCHFDFTEMPYDTQDCHLTFMLPNVAADKILLSWADISGDKLRNAEWTIHQAEEWERSAEVVTIPNQFGEILASKLTARFSLERRPYHMLKSYVLQVCMFFTLSWIGLWIDPAAVPARAAIGIIPVLVCSNKISTFLLMIPAISYSTRMDSFMVMTLAMITFHMLEFGLVHFAARQYKKLKEMEGRRAQAWIADGGESAKGACPERSQKSQVYWTLIEYTHLYLDLHMRWLSPLVFAIATTAMLA